MSDFSKDQTDSDVPAAEQPFSSTGPETKPPVVVPIGATLLSILMAALLWGGWVFLHADRNDAPASGGGPPAEEVQRP